MNYLRMESPWGPLLLAEDDAGLQLVRFMEGPRAMAPEPGWTPVERLACGVEVQLDEYFRGRRQSFDLPYARRGTDFQQQVWKALDDIPFGQTMSYGDIARQIGRPKAVRAVGAANGANPWAIVRPCHRVIGSNGTLTGYAGGLAYKEGLLALEAGVLPE